MGLDFAQLVPVTTIPTRGSGLGAIPASQRLDLAAGFDSIDLHVTLSANSANYGVLRYFPQDDEWRLERGLSLFDSTVPHSALDPLSIPRDRAMSLAIYRDTVFADPGPTESAILSATVR
jgi:hypothetical protein